MAIRLSEETRRQALESIKRYFTEQMDEEIGELKADLLLRFFVEELGPSVYNLAIADAQAQLQQAVVDLDGSCFEPEFTFWHERGQR